jgi:polysaccharide pyruvyl transferase WcaK-like protein
MNESMRIAILADIGQPVYHVGDEAIGLASANALRARGVEPVMLAREPQLLEPVFDGTDRVATVTVPWGVRDRIALFNDVQAGRAWTRPDIAALRKVLATCDGLHLAGGGNLNSRYGWLLTERAIVAAIARDLGLRITLGGQTIGPAVHAADRDQLASITEACAALGVRDEASATWLTANVPTPHGVHVGVDDASFLAPAAEPGTDATHISVTFSPDLDGSVGTEGLRRIASLLDDASAELDLPVWFEPHMQRWGSGDLDGEIHARIAAYMTREHELLPIGSAAGTAGRMATAAFVVTNRFHPVVFAAAQSVPVIAFGGSHYANARLDGALAHWGLTGLRAPAAAVLDDAYPAYLRTVLAQRDDIRSALSSARDALRTASDQWWDVVAGSVAVEVLGESAPSTRSRIEVAATPAWWPRFDALEAQLEHARIDLELATAPVPGPPPASLARRVVRYLRRRFRPRG